MGKRPHASNHPCWLPSMTQWWMGGQCLRPVVRAVLFCYTDTLHYHY